MQWSCAEQSQKLFQACNRRLLQCCPSTSSPLLFHLVIVCRLVQRQAEHLQQSQAEVLSEDCQQLLHIWPLTASRVLRFDQITATAFPHRVQVAECTDWCSSTFVQRQLVAGVCVPSSSQSRMMNIKDCINASPDVSHTQECIVFSASSC